MILYVNGCSHSAAAQAAVPHAWSCDDGNRWGTGKEPHPANLAVSYGKHIADSLGAELICQASSGGSNDRVIRTTRDWIQLNPDKLADTVMILQWTTWEREEWLYDNIWYQVNASGIDHVPNELEHRYKNFVINVDWPKCTRLAHQKIWNFHCELTQQGITHLFFSGNSHFAMPVLNSQDRIEPVILPQDRKDWGINYLGPYSIDLTYHNWLKNNGGAYANASSNHFDANSHRLWANFMLQYIKDTNFLGHNEISVD